jgi:hypothetical protein
MPPHDCQDITKRPSLFVIPGSLLERKLSIGRACLPKEGHKTVEAKEKRCHATGDQIRPVLATCAVSRTMRSPIQSART